MAKYINVSDTLFVLPGGKEFAPKSTSEIDDAMLDNTAVASWIMDGHLVEAPKGKEAPKG